MGLATGKVLKKTGKGLKKKFFSKVHQIQAAHAKKFGDPEPILTPTPSKDCLTMFRRPIFTPLSSEKLSEYPTGETESYETEPEKFEDSALQRTENFEAKFDKFEDSPKETEKFKARCEEFDDSPQEFNFGVLSAFSMDSSTSQ